MLYRGTNLAISSISSPYFVHYCTWKFKFALYISHRTHLDSLWVRVHLGGVRVRVRVHKTRVRVHSAWVRVHRGGVRVRVRVHKGRVRVRTRVRTRTRTHPLSPSPSPDSLQHWSEIYLTPSIKRKSLHYEMYTNYQFSFCFKVVWWCKISFLSVIPNWNPVETFLVPCQYFICKI